MILVRIVNRAQRRDEALDGGHEPCRALVKGDPCTCSARWTLTLDDGTSIAVCRAHASKAERHGRLEVWERAKVQRPMQRLPGSVA